MHERERTHVVFLFLDGVGIGTKDPLRNPFFSARLPNLSTILGGTLPHLRERRLASLHADMVPLDANLGIAGLPQSGTGQTTIFTGVNAAQVIGRHFGPYPTTELRPILAEKNFFHVLKSRGHSVSFANAFPRQFFEYANAPRTKLTVSTFSCRSSGVPLLDADSLRANRAVSPDFIRHRWSEMGYPDIAPISVEEAAHHMNAIARHHDFTFFEYWITDKAGHAQNMEQSVLVLERLDTFLGCLMELADLRSTLFLISSDHGNLEDLSVKTHTRNPVPFIAIGKRHASIVSGMTSLVDLAPRIYSLFEP